jgi:hypothetical protein
MYRSGLEDRGMRFVFGLLLGIIIGAIAMYLLSKNYNVSLGPLEHG